MSNVQQTKAWHTELHKWYQNLKEGSENLSYNACLWSAEDAEKLSLTNQG